ncbi:putative bifunctional diguanylate cyclase/phosphodiesterase [Frankia sp. AgKG'84/4]|uniref:putative bifunctional diguanylate cyclase/phosphodiesterase n=1 Tax=Frankia sp. AgKG'84/4 TaxID=573490 RepID=UPI00200BD946|nr:EAL domain-containing protein [Frankia sp. AgKG'84/4]MCL9795312.1 EAL domain-containing protein [Frankia sp. AgKG'84/4]
MDISLPPDVRERGIMNFARVWTHAVVAASRPGATAGSFPDALRNLSGSLVDTLLSQPFAASPADEVGAALADLTHGAEDALAATIEVCGRGLPAAFGLRPDADCLGRIAVVQGALARGFTQAARERICAEQDSIYRAAHKADHDRLRILFSSSTVGIVVANGEGRILDTNVAFRDMVGREYPWQVLGRPLSDFVDPGDAERVGRSLASQRRAGPGGLPVRGGELRLVDAAGSIIQAELTTSCQFENDRCTLQLSMILDVTDRHRLQEELRYRSRHDPLTGLPNRTVLEERAAELMRAGPQRRLGLCVIDLDGFRAVNESLGHTIGDQLLVAVAERLRRLLRAGQELVQIGGDEFVILLADTAGIEDVIAVARLVLAALTEAVRVGEHALPVGASLGLVERAAAEGDVADLLCAADITLYQAKESSRGKWMEFDAAHHDRRVRGHRLSMMLPAAVREDQFVVEFQPIVDLQGWPGAGQAEMVGAEALVRWRNPGVGWLTPDEFIALAEGTGQIVPLGRRVLQLACEQAARWQRLRPDRVPYVSVNLTVRQAREPGLVDQVRQILGDTGLPPELLQLELTESALLGPAGESTQALIDLAAMGVRIAIDDFGTGYSNLAYLPRLPVDTLKLAGPFVERLDAEQQDGGGSRVGALVDSMVALAKGQQLKVTAEGVETAMQAEWLRRAGCDSAQGYLFDRPLRDDQIIHRLCAPEPGAGRGMAQVSLRG